MNLKQRISSFVQLGQAIDTFLATEVGNYTDPFHQKLEAAVYSAFHQNGWFTKSNVELALRQVADQLKEENLTSWVEKYPIEQVNSKKIGVIMAGNLPLVGFHDFLCVLLSGHAIAVKLSSQDRILMTLFSEFLRNSNPEFSNCIYIVEDRLKDMDAVIATGSDNSSRYFDYYFGKYPHIIRRNRNSVAVLDGNESEEELKGLANDVFDYFGLGCRSVSKLFVPEGYDFQKFFGGAYSRKEVMDNNKYANNYEYNRTIFLMNNADLLDNGFLIIKEDESFSSPVGVLFYEYYRDENSLNDRLIQERQQIQCVVGRNHLPFGRSQYPALYDYADGVDTMKFLTELE